MRIRLMPVTSSLVLASALPLAAQELPAGLMGDLLRDVITVEEKVTALAREMPAEAWAWRPGEGVRSTGEVFQHIAADNWLLGGIAGKAPPEHTGIDPTSYETAQAYERRSAARDEVIDQLTQSFAFLKEAMTATSDAQLESEVAMFGRPATRRRLWVLTTTHLHEHLGQLIAYARTNGVTPPWSR